MVSLSVLRHYFGIPLGTLIQVTVVVALTRIRIANKHFEIWTQNRPNTSVYGYHYNHLDDFS
jgi:hypothetical protein